MSIKVSGAITQHLPTKSGSGQKGDWANASYIVKEQGVEHPQQWLFSMFKNGDYTKIATEFSEKNPVGTLVEVEYNSKVREWTNKQGQVQYFPENSVWRVETLSTPVSSGGGLGDGSDPLPF
ncbi:MAG: hypothetical protein Unbinned4388contig1000_52 [Prokaryotic dsDNA virus sp.]|nr:MAG: hypothetical protein Unbinned4388contig1000_52 [Prokaryotic dsDNA virus sp.]|tara:strand:- start:63872 stop:64237 length:366 start_codon:yes stop_codon:yes gene_type:complete